jgi:hypothetical protein
MNISRVVVAISHPDQWGFWEWLGQTSRLVQVPKLSYCYYYCEIMKMGRGLRPLICLAWERPMDDIVLQFRTQPLLGYRLATVMAWYSCRIGNLHGFVF